MAAKKKHNIIEDVAFRGTECLTANDLKRLCVKEFSDAPKTLLEDYENTPIVFVGITLSDDNTKIENSTAVSAGILRGASVNASKIWKFGTHEVQLNFDPIDLAMFKVGYYSKIICRVFGLRPTILTTFKISKQIFFIFPNK